MKPSHLLLSSLILMLITSCKSVDFPHFTNRVWHIDKYSGNAVSNDGMELAFGCEWMVTDTTLIQNDRQFDEYPALKPYFTDALALFPEIAVDSILLYNHNRGLMFALYHQKKLLKPTTEIFDDNDPDRGEWLLKYNDVFGNVRTGLWPGEWENGPVESVFTNLRYDRRNKLAVQLQRAPYRGQNLAIFSIYRTAPKKVRNEDYPLYPFWNIDLGDLDNVEILGITLHNSRTHAIENLRLGSGQTPD